MVKVTRGTILSIVQAANVILTTYDLPVRASWRLERAVGFLAPMDKDRTDLIKKYGTEQPNGTIKVDEKAENYQEFVDELNKLLAEEVECPHVVDIAVFGDVNVKGALIAGLGPLLVDSAEQQQ